MFTSSGREAWQALEGRWVCPHIKGVAHIKGAAAAACGGCGGPALLGEGSAGLIKYARASPAAGDSAQTVRAADGTAAVQFEWVGPARPLFAACSGALTCAARALAPARACPTRSLRAEPFVCAWRSQCRQCGRQLAGGGAQACPPHPGACYIFGIAAAAAA